LLVACSDATPKLQGSYDFSGSVDQVDPVEWQLLGTLTIFHDGGNSFAGAYILWPEVVALSYTPVEAWTISGNLSNTPVGYHPTTGDLTHTAFESDGSVRFRMGSIRADGAFQDDRLTGDWVDVRDGSTVLSGTFTAVRQDP
jgi:hypothetical protein